MCEQSGIWKHTPTRQPLKPSKSAVSGCVKSGSNNPKMAKQ